VATKQRCVKSSTRSAWLSPSVSGVRSASRIGSIPPIEAEAAYYAALKPSAMVA
jgi:hypothetical protein